MRGKQSLHFTALSTVNRIMDFCIVNKNYEFGSSIPHYQRQSEADADGSQGNCTADRQEPSSSNTAQPPSSSSTSQGPLGGGAGGGGGGGGTSFSFGKASTNASFKGSLSSGGNGGVDGGGSYVRFHSHAHPHTGLNSRLAVSGDKYSSSSKYMGVSSPLGPTSPCSPLSGSMPPSSQGCGSGAFGFSGASTSQPQQSSSSTITYSSTLNRISSLHKRRTSQVSHDHQQQQQLLQQQQQQQQQQQGGGAVEEDEFGRTGGNSAGAVARTPLEILLSLDPSQIVSCLHNNITMHKRIIGTRHKCTPSVRQRHCTHHCLQIMSARVLTIMCHSAHVQHKLVTRGHLKMLVEALDPNHDPQLLCLLLQALACVAMTPAYHASLSDADVADMLMQLLLPSDEWYYTNHSTKYAKYVKYHAARILVYMGMFHKLGGRVDIFDRRPFVENTSNSLLQVHSPEDSFIELMAMGKIVMLNSRGHLEAASMEGLIAEIIQEAASEERECQTPLIRFSGSQTSLSGLLEPPEALSAANCAGQQRPSMVSPLISPSNSMEFVKSVNKQSVRDYFLTGLPMVVHPVIVLRLLSHRLFGNMIRRKTLYSDAKLKPPKVDKVDSCPPRKQDSVEHNKDLEIHYGAATSTSEVHPATAVRVVRGSSQQQQYQQQHLHFASESASPPSKRMIDLPEQSPAAKLEAEQRQVPGKKKPCLRVMISDSGIDEEEGHIHDLDDRDFEKAPVTRTSSGGAVGSSNFYTQNKNGTTTRLALRAIGESLVTPLDLDIKSKNKEGAGGSVHVSPPADTQEILAFDIPTKQKKLFRWPSKKRLYKSQANVQIVHQDSFVSGGGQVTSGSPSEASTPEVDIVAFQRELINLPTFVMETPQIEGSPVFIRSSSVPENLASRHRSNIINSSTGQLHVHTDMAEVKHSPTRPTFIFPSPTHGRTHSSSIKAGSMVTITTTDVGGGNERILHNPLTSSHVRSSVSSSMLPFGSHRNHSISGQPGDHLTNTSRLSKSSAFPFNGTTISSLDNAVTTGDVVSGTTVAAAATVASPEPTITVRFEAPSSPNPSTSSQSPQTHFDFPNIPPSSSFSNHLSVRPEYSAAVSLAPLISQPQQYVSSSTPALHSYECRNSLGGPSIHAPPMTTSSNEIPLQHRGVLRVMETWTKICQTDLEGNSLMALETREFLKRLSAMGHEYKIWCQRFGTNLRLEVSI
ncbi:1-phosphatidylinositol-4,5-bisphosphate phosphodiesterase epsilon-1 [Elysia marginata]|uniref:1-phosphatidylinositol-4,5-bisphosphate phosphodiesterase epsilon-1 n=1 Tax=Elysia marginata TaxID=1093978 RepID=A0AAV4GE34_9GAST|nr:1-phosphatidylinositol-4,5-bisphosphate phosphodiesterase epsilon-1 [Elysia marginata]